MVNQWRTAEFLNSLNPNPGFDANSIYTAGTRSNVPIVDTATGYFLSLLCSIKKPATMLEIGSGFGYSAHFLLSGHARSTLVSLDTNSDRVTVSRKFCLLNGYASRAEFIHQNAADFFDQNARLFDLIFLDSMKKEYPDFLNACIKRLHLGGLLIADNILFQNRVLPEHPIEKKYVRGVEGLRRFIDLATHHPELHAIFLPIDDGIMVGTKITANSTDQSGVNA